MSENEKQLIGGGRYERRSPWQMSTMGMVAEFYDHNAKKRVFVKEFMKRRFPASTRDSKGVEHPSLVETRERAQRFYDKSVRVNARIREIAHAGGDLVVTTDFFRDGLFIYKVCDLVEMEKWSGEQVKEHLSVDQIDLLMMRLSNALQALHSSDVLHCDLKPENIFIVRDREGFYVGMLSDFDDSFLLSQLPHSNDIVCTPAYMSPELGWYKKMGGSEPEFPLGPASDVFALGLVYHEYLTGRFPDFDEDCEQLYAALLRGDPLQLDASLDPAHRLLLLRMLTTLPYDRMQTCAEVRNSIAAIRRRAGARFTLNVLDGRLPLADRDAELWVTFRCDSELGEAQHAKLCDLHTDSRGQVELMGLTDCEYSLRCGDTEVPVAWEGSGKTFHATVQMVAACPCTLTVLHDGRPVTDKAVVLHHFGEDRVKKGSYAARTDARGVAVFEDLPDGVFQAVVDNVRQAFRWNADCAHTFHIVTWSITLLQGGAPAAGREVELVGYQGGEGKAVSVRSDSRGVIALHNLNRSLRYAIRCDGREHPLAWSAERRATVQLAVQTQLRIGVLMGRERRGVMNAVVCVGQMRDGRFVRLAEGRTDARGMAELGTFDEGEYLVGVMQLPIGVTLQGQKIGQAVRMKLSGPVRSAAFTAAARTEGVILDREIPPEDSLVYSHIVRYNDGGVVLTCRRDGSMVTIRANQLALKGLEKYM